MNKIIIERVGLLKGFAERISKGDVDFQIPINRKDEINQTAATFNIMIENIKNSRNELIEEKNLYKQKWILQ